jgi:hypothetical protein
MVWCWPLSLLLLAALGCGKSDRVPVVPVSGTVTLNGEPLPGAAVTFIPAGETLGTGGSAVTAADGSYTLTSREGRGLVPGEYRVTISRWLRPDGSPPPAEVAPIDSDARETLPERFSDRDQTILTATVSEGGAAIDFPLRLNERTGQ